MAVNLRDEGPLELEGHGHVANVGLASVAEKKVPYTVNVLKLQTFFPFLFSNKLRNSQKFVKIV